jgi:hypothetical protein
VAKSRGLFISIIVLSFILCFTAEAQEVNQINVNNLKTVNTAMYVLGSWSILNLVSSPIASNLTQGDVKYFHRMNGYWNIVNFGLVAFTVYSQHNIDYSGLSAAESLNNMNSLENLLLINAGLDVAYVTGGFLLMERSKNVKEKKDMLKGFGKSLILQGSFLLVFDLIFYHNVHQNTNEMIGLLNNLSFNGNSILFKTYF